MIMVELVGINILHVENALLKKNVVNIMDTILMIGIMSKLNIVNEEK